PAELVVGAADRKPASQARGGDLPRAASHRLDLPQGGGGESVCGQRCEQQRDRAADEELCTKARQCLVPVVARDSDDNDEPLTLSVHRNREQANGLSLRSAQRPIEEAAPSPRPRERARVEHGPAREPCCTVEDPAAPVEHLREAVPRVLEARAAGLAEPRIGLAHERPDYFGPRAQARIERSV